MGKCYWLFVCVCWWTLCLRAQTETLAYIGGTEAGVAEYRFYCSRQGGTAEVDDWVTFKLKALAARKAGLDTVPRIRQVWADFYRGWLMESLVDENRVDSAARACYEKLQRQEPAVSLRVCHIFKSLPQNVSAGRLAQIENEMDSIYRGLSEGKTDFAACVRAYSDDKDTFWVARLEMPVEFEEVVYALPVGTISRPFFTPQGMHITKVLERKTIPPFHVVRTDLKRQLVYDESGDGVRAKVEQLKGKYGYRVNQSGMEELMRTGKTEQALFFLADKVCSGTEFAWFAASHPASLSRQLDAFVTKTLLDYERKHLESRVSDHALQLRFFKDSLLAAEMEKQEIGLRMGQDSIGVQRYFEDHRKKYDWEHPRFDGIVLHAKSKRTARKVRKFLKKLPAAEWMDAIRMGVNAGGTTEIVAEKGVFAMGENTYVDDEIFKQGTAVPMEGFPHTSLLGEKIKGPTCWKEVGDRLWDDYYVWLEQQWLKKLRQVFKVEINQQVLKTVNNH